MSKAYYTDSTTDLNRFELMHTRLQKIMGSTPVISPFRVDITDLKARVANMIQCDVVITGTDWYNDPLSVKEVNIARELNIEVKSITTC